MVRFLGSEVPLTSTLIDILDNVEARGVSKMSGLRWMLRADDDVEKGALNPDEIVNCLLEGLLPGKYECPSTAEAGNGRAVFLPG
jgi:hypothetical protein